MHHNALQMNACIKVTFKESFEGAEGDLSVCVCVCCRVL